MLQTVAYKTTFAYVIHQKKGAGGGLFTQWQLTSAAWLQGVKEDRYEINISHNRGADFAINTDQQSGYRVWQLHM